MSIKIVFEFDGEIMLNDVPVEYSPTRIVEDAIRQLRAEIKARDSIIAERDAEIATLSLQLKISRNSNLDLRVSWERAHVGIAERDAQITGLTGELARLRAQGPVAWVWNDMIGIPHTHISPTRPTWPDAGASSAMSVAIDVRPLYAEPMPEKPRPDICSCQMQPAHYAGEMPCPLSQAAKVAE